MTDGGYMGYLNYAVTLLLITGLLQLVLDVRRYEMAAWDKEKRVTRFLGWLNVGMGVLLYVGNWALQKWAW